MVTRSTGIWGNAMTSWILVEDEIDLHEMLLAMADTFGVEGVAFVDGEEAIQWIEDAEAAQVNFEMPQLAMLDIRLPGDVSGPMIAARIRQSPLFGNIPIVMITAYKLSVEQEQEIMNYTGADLLLYKPLPNLGELHRMLVQVIGAH
jgi:CheY-like chemotaxis protein